MSNLELLTQATYKLSRSKQSYSRTSSFIEENKIRSGLRKRLPEQQSIPALNRLGNRDRLQVPLIAAEKLNVLEGLYIIATRFTQSTHPKADSHSTGWRSIRKPWQRRGPMGPHRVLTPRTMKGWFLNSIHNLNSNYSLRETYLLHIVPLHEKGQYSTWWNLSCPRSCPKTSIYIPLLYKNIALEIVSIIYLPAWGM